MDPINSNSFFDPSGYHRIQPTSPAASTAKTSEHLNTGQIAPQAASKVEKVETFSSLFDDSALEHLQKNLESIADMADTALKRMRSSN